MDNCPKAADPADPVSICPALRDTIRVVRVPRTFVALRKDSLMLRSVKSLLAVGAVVVAMVPGIAPAVPAPQIVDPAGDATSINDQGVTVANAINAQSKASPKQIDALDILGVTFSTEFVARKPTNLLVAMKLAAPPASETEPHKYVVRFYTGSCVATHALEMHIAPTNPPGVQDSYSLPASTPDNTPVLGKASGVVLWTRGASLIRGGCFNDAATVPLPKSTISGNVITWRVPLMQIARPGVLLSVFQAESRMRLRSSDTYSRPVVDIARSAATYVVGK